ncbi:hypothetical protein [Halomonas marinisediminis]|uniref:Uncharacterized protein n=1 Tax=Halomonas marinisediminis TaxID=2546095 RepID=A0ABY2D3H2_9GAMM|nr:hypothetical protein [Halomonas marinisediminis]TDA95377.1 hypothetical protein E0702_15690 [Halomonas marinisediminis]
MNRNMIVCNTSIVSDMDSVVDGRYLIRRDGVDFEFLLQNASRISSKKLFVLLSGARDPNRHPLPKFDRWKWVDKFPGAMLNVSDPSFYKKEEGIRIGWYTGPRDHSYIESITSIVREFAGCLGIQNKDIIFYGSSAGGFAALSMGCHVNESTSVCINPQINVLKYNLNHVVNNFLKYVYQAERGDLTDQDMLRLDVSRLFKKAETAKCLYVQNVLDVHHYQDHYKYFIDCNGESDNNHLLETMLFSSKTGHGPEPSNLVNEIIQKALAISER